MDRRRAVAIGCTATALLIVLAFTVVPARANPAPAVTVVELRGRGWGHGVGLAQWGAEHLARTGHRWEQIVGRFYPGTAIGEAAGNVRVAVHVVPTGFTTLEFPHGGEVRSPLMGEQREGFPVRLRPGGAVRVSFDGTYRVAPVARANAEGRAVSWEAPARAEDSEEGCIPLVTCPSTTSTTTPKDCLLCTTTTVTAPSTTTTAPRTTTTAGGSGGTSTTVGSPAVRSGAPVWAVPAGGHPTTVADRGRTYRGVLELTAGAGPLRVINQVDVETYLKGMAEVPSAWPLEAIAAQAVAARTWALRAMNVSGELCDYDRCQVYVGATREHPRQSEAVDATRGRVLTYGGGLASTVYSADAGGISATTLEGFGTPNGRYPYLTTVRYPSDHQMRWRTLVGLDHVAARLAYPGKITAVRVAERGPSGRALKVAIEGSAGRVVVDGLTFGRTLGLRSTLFSARLTTASGAPPPPVDSGALAQALPDDARAIREAARTTRPPRAASEPLLRGDGAAPPVAGRALADHPATFAVLLLAGVVTAWAMARIGLRKLPYGGSWPTLPR